MAAPTCPDVFADASATLASLRHMGLIGQEETPTLTPLTGGVSSLILRVDTADGRHFCVKRSLPQLKVAALWQAPIERNRAEVEWLRLAAEVCPQSVPALIGQDREGCAFAMEFLEPGHYPVWKNMLREGDIRLADARAVGHALAGIHAHAAGRHEVAQAFAHDEAFYALRLEPYFIASAQRHPDLASTLKRLVTTTQQTRHTLMHGDVSPKNILIGPQGPVLLDAECACWGDAAFDLGFVLNHLLLKSVWRPQHALAYLTAFDALAQAYLAHVEWEDAAELEARTCDLLGGLLLARVDGKSPAEYLTEPDDQQRVRRVACDLLKHPARRLSDVRLRWMSP